MLNVRVLVANEIVDVRSIDRLSDGSKRVEPKTRRSKSQKSAKSQKLFKSRISKGEKLKKPSKNRNSPNFDAKNSGPSFVTPEARSAFNRLQLAFTKSLILWHFDPECHIDIETDTLGYVISVLLS